MNIFMLTIGFRPNIGGIETHFDDFIKAAEKRKIKVTVLTYQPINSNARGKAVEKSKNYTVYRLPVISGFFYKLVQKPILEFLYLVPGLFLVTPFLLLQKNYDAIHAHGLISGFVGVIWGKIFNKRVVISTHSIYHFPASGMYSNFAKFIFSNANVVLCLSEQSVEEMKNLGVDNQKLKKFTYWVDLDIFKPVNKQAIKKEFNWDKKFVVLFVGRLVPEKGINELLAATKNLNKNILVVIAGVGPLENTIKKQELNVKNVKFLGKITNDKLPEYYNVADVLIVPSIHEEGFGRVILESLACGTPVIAANRGGITEAIDKTVGLLIDITPENIARSINYLYSHSDKISMMSKLARKFTEDRYSEKNAQIIINACRND